MKDSYVPKKIIKCYPKNKPWIAKEVKDIITRKRVTFSSGDKAKLKSLQKETELENVERNIEKS